MFLERYEEAIAPLERSIAIDAEYARPWKEKGHALWRLDRTDEALEALERSSALAPDDDWVWWAKGEILQSLNRHEEALAAYDRALALDPTDVDTWEGKVRSLDALQRYEEALVVNEHLVALEPDSAHFWITFGYIHYQLRHYEEAIAAYDHALGLAPGSVFAWAEKGRSLNKLTRYDEALAAVDHALALDNAAFEDEDAPDRSNLTALRGTVLRRLGRHGDAMAAYDTMLALQPANPEAYVGMAWVARDQHDDEAVVRYAEQALALDPTCADAARQRAAALYRLKCYEQALPAYELATKLDPTEGMWRFMGMTLHHLGRDAEALSAFEQAIALMPTSSEAWAAKTSALVALHRYEEALTTSDDALRAIPGHSVLEEARQDLQAIVRRSIPDQRMRLRDGRWLGFLDCGDPAGKPILYCYGMPSSRLEGVDFEKTLQALHLRLIVPDRPGCGLSTDQPRRTILHWPDDVAELADHLSLGRFAMLGVSGGGPYAAACAYILPHRLTRVGLVSSDAPVDAPHYDAGANRIADVVWRILPWPIMRQAMRLLAYNSRSHPEAAEWSLRKRYPRADGIGRDELGITLPPGLRERITEPYQHGGAGYARDCYLDARPWGFRLEDITAAVWLWHGEQDTLAVPAMARYLAQAIPNCRATFYPGEGHSVLNNHINEILTALTAIEAE